MNEFHHVHGLSCNLIPSIFEIDSNSGILLKLKIKHVTYILKFSVYKIFHPWLDRKKIMYYNLHRDVRCTIMFLRPLNREYEWTPFTIYIFSIFEAALQTSFFTIIQDLQFPESHVLVYCTPKQISRWCHLM